MDGSGPFEAGRHEEAISTCIAAKRFDKAKALAQGNPALRRRVEEAYEGHLVSNEDTGELVDLGRAEVALDVAAKKGDWDKVWDIAAKQRLAPAAIGKYVLMRIEEVSGNGDDGDDVDV